MSEEEEVLTESEEEDGDFSASEDEWLPTKKSAKKGGKKRGTAGSSDEEDGEEDDDDSVTEDESDLEDFEESPKKKGKQQQNTTSRKRSATGTASRQSGSGAGKKKRLSPGLRDRLYQQYKKDLLKEVCPVKPPLNSSVSDILQKCQFQRKSMVNAVAQDKQEEDDSGSSSGDDHLVDPEKLDLGSTFFDKKEEAPGTASSNLPEVGTSKPSAVPHFDVNAGMRLSDSSDGEDDAGAGLLPASIPKQAADELISHINQRSGDFMNFNNLDQFTAKVEEAKRLLRSYQQRQEPEKRSTTNKPSQTPSEQQRQEQERKDSISCLLAQGEATDGGSRPGQVPAPADASSDSDWEEVDNGGDTREQKTEESSAVAENKDGALQVTIELDNAQSRRKRREELEMELYIKRQINKVKRTNRLNYHKSSVVVAVAIGQRLNRTVDSDRVRGLLLSVMQDQALPSKVKWDEKRMQNLYRWFKAEFTLQSHELLAPRTGCTVSSMLALALFTRKVQCCRDYILLFLACLRSAGAQARLVLSAVVPSKRPPMSELCPMSERQIKENLEKKEAKLSPKPKIVQIKSNKQLTSHSIVKQDDHHHNVPEAPEIAKPTVDEPSITARKENAAVPRRSPRGSKIMPEKDTVPMKRSSRKALTTLNIPQLDGGDDAIPGKAEVKSLRRSHRSKSAAIAQVASVASPGTSPFAMRKSNTPKTTSGAKPANSSEAAGQSAAARKRKLFPADKDSLEPATAPKATQRKTRSNTVQPSQTVSKTTKMNTEEPKVKRKAVTKRLKSPSANDGDAAVIDKVEKKPSQPEKENSHCTVLDQKIPVVMVEKMVHNKSIDRKVLSSSSESDAELGGRKLNGSIATTSRKQATVRNRTNTKKPKPAYDETDDDSDFEMPTGAASNRKPKKSPGLATAPTKAKKSHNPRRSKTGDHSSANKDKIDLWIEFYCEKAQRWITFDTFSGRADCKDYIVRIAPNPISYVFAWDNEGYLKDVTARYVQNWNTACRMLRAEQPWLDRTLAPFIGPKTERDVAEDNELNKLDADKPLPKTIGELKNHPLYALRRHLLKFEALYPQEPQPLGFIRSEAIYPRECVHTLQTREKWYKQGRVVRAFETAYKVVKCWKYDRPNNNWLKDQPCDLFGHWQTDEYDPPTAENGVVPRNEYGNVELFTEKMLPKGTVHLKLPGLNKVCKRLQIDCAPALTGFDMAKMRVVPVYDGFVVCEEFAEKAVEEWYKDMEEEERREQEKLEKRVYGNWKRLIKGLLVRRKLQNKYNFDNLA
ncbi:DNA repair protein complementing XP-C cells homolog [Anopheles aquasalis]|uniref:DNA repair protein complementing XP-C cells homolog n=1 Tax=Anopheles aquasalis TaxID=42839 RepID=UPI00215B0A2E|nr:DNA repair protein complementing XP-C cells homolog [Anopheles aquasalis]